VRSIFRNYGLPLLLLAATAVTTTANGARFMQNFMHGLPPVGRDGDLWPWDWLARNPRTGTEVSIAPGKAVRFKPGKELHSLETTAAPKS
jgi:hypothetical protein